MEINVVDPIKWVRSEPERFFNSSEPNSVHILAYIMDDIVELGKGDCIIRRAGDWFVIGSDLEWLKDEKYNILDLFNNIVHIHAHAHARGRFSMRGEILVNAYARNVAVFNKNKILQVKGDSPPSAVIEKAVDMQQAILFRM